MLQACKKSILNSYFAKHRRVITACDQQLQHNRSEIPREEERRSLGQAGDHVHHALEAKGAQADHVRQVVGL